MHTSDGEIILGAHLERLIYDGLRELRWVGAKLRALNECRDLLVAHHVEDAVARQHKRRFLTRLHSGAAMEKKRWKKNDKE